MSDDAKKGFGIMHAGMAVCCAVMLIPIAGYFVAGGTVAGLTSNLVVFAPLALCIAVHGLLFVLMGKSCHGSSEDTIKDATFEEGGPVPETITRSKS